MLSVVQSYLVPPAPTLQTLIARVVSPDLDIKTSSTASRKGSSHSRRMIPGDEISLHTHDSPLCQLHAIISRVIPRRIPSLPRFRPRPRRARVYRRTGKRTTRRRPPPRGTRSHIRTEPRGARRSSVVLAEVAQRTEGKRCIADDRCMPLFEPESNVE